MGAIRNALQHVSARRASFGQQGGTRGAMAVSAPTFYSDAGTKYPFIVDHPLLGVIYADDDPACPWEIK